MTNRNTLIRSMHELGLATWFGGSLMGAIGLNGGAAKAKDPAERLRVSSIGWARWTPVQLAAIGSYGIGGLGLMLADRNRLGAQDAAKANTAVHVVLAAAAGAASVVGGLAGARILKHSDEGGTGVTEPGSGASEALANAQRVEKVTQWLIPSLTAALIVLAAQQGELQRPGSIAEGVAGRAKRLVRR